MSKKEHFKFSLGVIAYPVFFVIAIWMVFAVEIRFGYNFSKYGIYPQTFKGLRGVIFSPFIHGNVKHIYHNTVPLFVLCTALFYFYNHIAWRIILYGILLSGFLTWCIGRPSYHIGISGLIYVLVSFTFFKGVFAKHYRLIALSLVVVFLYGSMIWYTLPIENGVSWEGHSAGLVTGLLFAFLFRKEIAEPKKYIWQQENFNEDNDPFLKYFDADGNFIEHLEPEIEPEEALENEIKAQPEPAFKVTYIYKKAKE